MSRLDILVDREDFEDAGATEVAGAAAVVAAGTLLDLDRLAVRHRQVERADLFGGETAICQAVLAVLAQQALSHRADQGRADHETFDAEVDQPVVSPKPRRWCAESRRPDGR